MALFGALPWWIALLAVLLLAGMVVWANQREAVLKTSDARASLAEERAATLEAVVTVQARTQDATATALALVGSPEAAVDRSLSMLLAAERDPTQERLRALSDAFGPAALTVVRPEVEHLLSGGLHLGGDSAYELDVLVVPTRAPEAATESATPTPGQASVSTRERWTYDERNADDQRSRCLVETSDQTYTLQQAGSDWQVVDIKFATASRTDC